MSNKGRSRLQQYGAYAWTLPLVTAASSIMQQPAPVCSSRLTRFLATSHDSSVDASRQIPLGDRHTHTPLKST